MTTPKTEPTVQPTDAERLKEIADILDVADQRCLASDGPVAKIQGELSDREFRRIYLLATGRRPYHG